MEEGQLEMPTQGCAGSSGLTGGDRALGLVVTAANSMILLPDEPHTSGGVFPIPLELF
jgi:hypothetical protein